LDRILCLTVIELVEGEEFGRIILEKAIQEANGEKKENLREALKFF